MKPLWWSRGLGEAGCLCVKDTGTGSVDVGDASVFGGVKRLVGAGADVGCSVVVNCGEGGPSGEGGNGSEDSGNKDSGSRDGGVTSGGAEFSKRGAWDAAEEADRVMSVFTGWWRP
jgi:hypothetical protein